MPSIAYSHGRFAMSARIAASTPGYCTSTTTSVPSGWRRRAHGPGLAPSAAVVSLTAVGDGAIVARSMDPETIRALFRALQGEGVEYVLVGALALDVLGIGRLTEDIDLFVRPTPENVASLRRALRRVWNDPSIEEITAEDLAGEYPAIQYVAPDGTPIDLLSRLGEAFTFTDLDATIHLYGDIPVRVATANTLYRMKRDTVRLQDKADAEVLRKKFRLEE